MTELEMRIDELKQARVAIAQLEALQATRRAELDAQRNEREQIKATQGERILAAALRGIETVTQAAITNSLTALIARIEANESLLRALDVKIRDAQQAERMAQGAALRAHAAELRNEAEARQARTNELLAQLAQWEGCDYMPTARLMLPEVGPGMAQLVTVKAPVTETLLVLACAYELDADAIEAGRPLPTLLSGQRLAELPEYI